MTNLHSCCPTQLYTLAHLFALQPSDYKTARILAIGSISSIALLSFSAHYKDAQLIFLEENSSKAQALKKLIDQLNIQNIEIIEKEFSDNSQTEFLGLFDYIIANEVYSYITPEARIDFLTFCRKHLAPSGILYISYNTLPAWNRLGSLREMIQYHTEPFESREEKIQQAYLFLNFLVDNLGDERSPYAQFLKQEIQLILHEPLDLIYRQYLDKMNNPCYFYTFIEEAGQHQLAYLSDDSLPMMFVGNLKDKFRVEIENLKDVIQVGQYIDFIRNQRFRSTLLCHANQVVNRSLLANKLHTLYISYTALYKESISKKALMEGHVLVFELKVPFALKLTLTRRLPKIIMKILHDEQGKPISYAQLLKKTIQASGESHAAVQHALDEDLNLARLLLSGFIKVYPDKGFYPVKSVNKPQTTAFIQSIIKVHDQIPNFVNEVYKLTPLERLFLQHVKGKKTTTELLSSFEALLAQKIETKEISLKSLDGGMIVDEAYKKTELKKLTKETFEGLEQKGYIVK